MPQPHRYAPSPQISWSDVEGELALFDTQSGIYHALNGSAAAIWRRLAHDHSMADIVRDLAARYRTDAADVAADVDAFVAEGLRLGLLARRP